MGEDGEIRMRQLLQHAAAEAASSALATAHDRRIQPGGFPYGHHNFYQYYYGYGYPFPDEEKFIGIIPWAMRILKALFIGILLMCSSIIMYGCFYVLVMPENYASRPLFFDYTGTVVYPHMDAVMKSEEDNNSHSMVSSDHKWWKRWKKDKSVENALSTLSASSFNSEMSSFPFTPWATVDLFAKEQAVALGETMNLELVPPQVINDRLLQPKQAYYVEVHLKLPESELNRNLGMFGVAVDLFSYSSVNETSLLLASSVRPARIPHESYWVGVARRLVWLLPLIFGGVEESRLVVVSPFRHAVETQEHPLRYIVVRLVGQPTGWNGQEQPLRYPVEVIGGEVRIGKELNDFQQMLKDWFYTCYAVGTMVLFGVHVGAYLLIQYYRRDAMDAFEDPTYFDSPCGFDEMRQQEYDGFDSVWADDNLDPDDNNNDNPSFDESSTSGTHWFDGEDVDTSGANENDGDDDEHYYACDDDSDDWEDLTGMEVRDAFPRQEQEGGSLSESLNQRSNAHRTAHVPISRPRESEFKRSITSASARPRPSNMNQKPIRTDVQWGIKCNRKVAPSSFAIGTVKFNNGRYTKCNEGLTDSKNVTPPNLASDCKRGLPSKATSANEVNTDSQDLTFFDCDEGDAVAHELKLDVRDGGAIELEEGPRVGPFRAEILPKDASSPSRAMGVLEDCDSSEKPFGGKSDRNEVSTGMSSPRCISFASKLATNLWNSSTVIDHPFLQTEIQGNSREKNLADDKFTNDGFRGKYRLDDCTGIPLVQESTRTCSISKELASAGLEECAAASVSCQGLDGSTEHGELNVVAESAQDGPPSNSDLLDIKRKPATPLTSSELAQPCRDMLRTGVPVHRISSSYTDDESLASSFGSWEELSVDRAMNRPVKWASIDYGEMISSSSHTNTHHALIEKLPTNLSPMPQSLYKESSTDIAAKQDDFNIFNELGNLDEAQLFDSFLHDMISPFVR